MARARIMIMGTKCEEAGASWERGQKEGEQEQGPRARASRRSADENGRLYRKHCFISLGFSHADAALAPILNFST